jgi:hypothetical protein
MTKRANTATEVDTWARGERRPRLVAARADSVCGTKMHDQVGCKGRVREMAKSQAPLEKVFSCGSFCYLAVVN